MPHLFGKAMWSHVSYSSFMPLGCHFYLKCILIPRTLSPPPLDTMLWAGYPCVFAALGLTRCPNITLTSTENQNNIEPVGPLPSLNWKDCKSHCCPPMTKDIKSCGHCQSSGFGHLPPGGLPDLMRFTLSLERCIALMEGFTPHSVVRFCTLPPAEWYPHLLQKISPL